MRRLIPHILVVASAAITLAACSSIGTTSELRAIGRPDPLCNAGRGLDLRPSLGIAPSGVEGSTSGLRLEPGDIVETSKGVTLVSFFAMDAQDNYGPMRIVAITAGCSIDRRFARDGVLDPVIPGVPPASVSFSITLGLNGNFFVTASRAQGWLIGEYEPSGAIDSNFGIQGWVLITPPGGIEGLPPIVTDLAVESSGQILVYGDNAQAHSTVQPYLYALYPNGVVNSLFGQSGHVALFTPSVEAGGLLVQSDRVILATGSSGGAGCYSMPVVWVSPGGYVQSSIGTNFIEAGPLASTSESFWGSAFLDPAGGLGIVGQSNSCGATTGPVSSIQEFNPNGTAASSFGQSGTAIIATPDPRDFDFSVAVLPDHHLVVESFANETSPYVFIRDFQSNGHVVPTFGHKGQKRLTVATLLTTLTSPSSVAALTRGDVGLLVPSHNGLTLEEIVG